jgi:hypothetical protein
MGALEIAEIPAFYAKPEPAAAGTLNIRSEDVVSRDIAGETLVVPVRRGVGDLDSVYTFNELGAHVWLLLEQGRTTEELVDWVRARFHVPAEQAFGDVARFIAELREERLVRSA